MSKLSSGPGYSNEKLSLNFQNIDLRALLGVFADFTNINIVTSDTVNPGVIYNRDSILYILAPTIMICLLIIALVWVGKALENVFNPAMRK